MYSMPCKWNGDSIAADRGGGTIDKQLTCRLENLEEKIDRLTDLCYQGLNDPLKHPKPKKFRCPSLIPDRDHFRNQAADNRTLSSADQRVHQGIDQRVHQGIDQRIDQRVDQGILRDFDRFMIIGELLFQFERRLFNVVIPKKQRFYGYAVRNIEQLIAREEDVGERVQFRCNLSRLNEQLRPFGYLPYYHSELSCSIINEYGVLARSAAEIRAMSGKLENIPFLKRLIRATLPFSLREDVLKLLDCLVFLCDQDGGKMFQF